MPAPVYALLDGNNFYASCERVFNPRLVGQPVVVLSNNDGCAIARSEEAKALGIRMGAPWFQIKHLVQEAGLVALSANFELYGDMSHRMMQMAEPLGCGQEIYSIDECFLDLSGVPRATERARALQAAVLRGIGIPTCIGMGPSKTLAKLANHIAKTADRQPGRYPAALAKVCHLGELNTRQQEWLLQRMDVGEVWGVGGRLAAQLQAGGIRTVLDLQRLDPAIARQRWSVVLERTVRELNGVPCLALDDLPPPKQQIACTRSFGAPVTALAELREAITEFASRAAHKLRQQHSQAHAVLVFIRTSPFRPQDAPYARSVTLPLRGPTADTVGIVSAALQALQGLYRPGFRYAKAGVMLLDLQADSQVQTELDWGDATALGQPRAARLMQAMDAVNRRYGQGTLRLGSAALAHRDGPAPSWPMKQARRSPRYTTRWDELLAVGT